MIFDIISYILGQKNGYGKGVEAGKSIVVIEDGITCTDDGEGNITITEDE